MPRCPAFLVIARPAARGDVPDQPIREDAPEGAPSAMGKHHASHVISRTAGTDGSVRSEVVAGALGARGFRLRHPFLRTC